MSKQNRRLTITGKGLILVAVPLFLQLLAIMLLLVQLTRSEAEINRQAFAVEAVAEADRLLSCAYGVVGGFYSYAYTGSDYANIMFNERVRDVAHESKQLREMLVKDGDVTGSAMDKLAGGLDASLAKVVDDKHDVDNQSSTPGLVQIKQRYAHVNNFIRATRRVARIAYEEFNPKGFRSDQSNGSVLLAVYGSLIGNLIAASALAIFFARGIESKIGKVSENIRRYETNEPLIPPEQTEQTLIQEDEIGELDRTFFQMANDLRSAHQRKEQFIALISNEISGPLNRLAKTLERLQSEPVESLDDDMKELVSNASSESKRIIALTRNLVDTARSQDKGTFALKLHPSKLRDDIQQSLSAVTLLAQSKSIEFTAVLDDPAVVVDRDRIIQVMVNLLSNAIKYSPQGTRVIVRLIEEPDLVRVEVDDNGPGISDQEKRRIFETFSRGRSAVGSDATGFGLGLAICKSIVEAHGGQIGIENGERGGSCFWFTIPLHQDCGIDKSGGQDGGG